LHTIQNVFLLTINIHEIIPQDEIIIFVIIDEQYLNGAWFRFIHIIISPLMPAGYGCLPFLQPGA
jgi:hypothetical protein